MTPEAMSRLAEFNEAHAYAQLLKFASAKLRDRHGLAVHRVGEVTAFVATGVAGSLMLNRVLGLGLETPVSDAQLLELDTLYRRSGVPTHAIELSPHAQPADLASRARVAGYLPFKKTTMMLREVGELAVPACKYDVRRVGVDHAASFASLTCGLFALEQPFPCLLEASFVNPCWQHWMAFDGDLPVATAMTCLHGEVAWIGWVATAVAYRGHGIQASLTAAQTRAAQHAGARWVTLETALAAKRQPGPSQRNYLRLGWTALYDRVVYLRRPG